MAAEIKPENSSDNFEVRAIQEHERQDCLDLWCRVWPGEDSPHYFRRYFEGDREVLPYYTRVGVLDNKIVSAVHICKRVVACGEQELTMGGIANVATLPEYRGRGYNAACLRSAIAVMEADAMDFALLFTGIHPYYEREGFEIIEKLWLEGRVRPDYIANPTPFNVRQAKVEDIEAIQRCYAEYNRHRPIAVQRYPAYWRDWINVEDGASLASLLVATDRSDSVVGYIRTGIFKSAVPYSAEATELRVIEYGTLDLPHFADSNGATSDELVAISLLNAVVERISHQTPRVLRLEIALGAAICSAFTAMVDEKTERYDRSGMVRLLHRENLFRSLSMLWNELWLQAGRPGGQLIFSTPYGAIQIDASGTLIRISPLDVVPIGQEPMSQGTFLSLLFGMTSPERATTDRSVQPLMNALFPPHASAFYGADGF